MSQFASDAPEKGAALSTETDSESSAVRVDALIGQLSSSDGEERSRARAALVTLGKPALAALLAMLTDFMPGEIWPEPRYKEKFKLQASLPKLRSEYHARRHVGVDRPSRRESFVAAGGNWAECLVGLYPTGDAHLG
jgi:hypothetical protein